MPGRNDQGRSDRPSPYVIGTPGQGPELSASNPFSFLFSPGDPRALYLRSRNLSGMLNRAPNVTGKTNTAGDNNMATTNGGGGGGGGFLPGWWGDAMNLAGLGTMLFGGTQGGNASNYMTAEQKALQQAMVDLINQQRGYMSQMDPLRQSVLSMAMGMMPMRYQTGLNFRVSPASTTNSGGRGVIAGANASPGGLGGRFGAVTPRERPDRAGSNSWDPSGYLTILRGGRRG